MKIESWTKRHIVVIRKPSDRRRVVAVPPSTTMCLTEGGEMGNIVMEEAGQTNVRQQQQQQNRYHLWICNSSHHHVYKVVNRYVLKAWLHAVCVGSSSRKAPSSVSRIPCSILNRRQSLICVLHHWFLADPPPWVPDFLWRHLVMEFKSITIIPIIRPWGGTE